MFDELPPFFRKITGARKQSVARLKAQDACVSRNTCPVASRTVSVKEPQQLRRTEDFLITLCNFADQPALRFVYAVPKVNELRRYKK